MNLHVCAQYSDKRFIFRRDTRHETGRHSGSVRRYDDGLEDGGGDLDMARYLRVGEVRRERAQTQTRDTDMDTDTDTVDMSVSVGRWDGEHEENAHPTATASS